MLNSSRPSGFTLIEMIMVIVITGIIGGMVAVFIRAPVEGYVDSVRRAELTDQADVALRRITRDVRLALPNSLRIKDTSNATVSTCDSATHNCYVEFIITKWGGRYRSWDDGSTGGNRLNFGSGTPPVNNPNCATNNCFDILGTSNPDNPPDIDNGDHIVILNYGPQSDPPSDAYLTGSNRNRDTVTLEAGTPYRATLTDNVFAGQTPPLPSPSGRFQVVGQSERVIRYGCEGGNLRRYRNCDFGTTTSCAANPPLLAQGARCFVQYENNATGRNGLLYISLTLTDSSGESVTLFQQIHIDNSP